MAEVVLSLNSITATIQDSYEALSGKSLYDGSELSTFDRSFAILGVVTLGFGSKLGKGLKFMGKVFAKTPMGTKALGMAERVLGTAQRIGITTREGIKDFTEFTKSTFGNEVGAVGKDIGKLVDASLNAAKQYIDDATSFFTKNRHLAESTTLQSGTKGLSIKTKFTDPNGSVKRMGGFFTEDGRVVTFWD